MLKYFLFCILHCVLVNSTLGWNKEITKKIGHFKDGILYRSETIGESAGQCYQYTWLGPENKNTNKTERCSDLETDDAEEKRPCFAPLVWTFNDELGSNRPDPKDIVDACNKKTPPCDPTCIKSGGQTCVKYTLMSNNIDNAVVRETSFCGRVVSDGVTVSNDVCRTQKDSAGYNVELCSCSSSQFCNAAFKNTQSSVVFVLLSLAIAFLLR
ncbi:uncharacterized protein LOC111700696 [Eurytemora carolleeae]|uniref:uncharacterized protein LOC111700696 n=1 Tax=Eurytemora carolleeae TaxID=1294199 RepID=UPI000C76B2E7|nr:uncharacterized protein LOC111700696 [Eurytemora carolleeae]|eukprot:XP_023327468.1 uncharacterized protein LOC111700696 [Eurytemora affinis]